MSTPVSPVATPLLLVPEFGDDCGSDDDDDNAHGTRLQLIACRRNITSSRRRRARLAHGTISRTSIAVDPRVQCAVRKPKLKATGQTGHTQTSWVVWRSGRSISDDVVVVVARSQPVLPLESAVMAALGAVHRRLGTAAAGGW